MKKICFIKPQCHSRSSLKELRWSIDLPVRAIAYLTTVSTETALTLAVSHHNQSPGDAATVPHSPAAAMMEPSPFKLLTILRKNAIRLPILTRKGRWSIHVHYFTWNFNNEGSNSEGKKRTRSRKPRILNQLPFRVQNSTYLSCIFYIRCAFSHLVCQLHTPTFQSFSLLSRRWSSGNALWLVKRLQMVTSIGTGDITR